jgi:hypothetical protein
MGISPFVEDGQRRPILVDPTAGDSVVTRIPD